MKHTVFRREQAVQVAAAALEYTSHVAIQNVSGTEEAYEVEFDEQVVMNDEELAGVLAAAERRSYDELAALLREAQKLGLTFDIGTAYIRRSYIDHQTDLNQRINAALARR